MMRWLFVAAVSAAMVCLCAGTLFGQSDVIIDVHDPGVVRIKIGVPPFVRDPASPAASPGLGEEIARVIREDLAFTGLFDVLDSPSQPVAPEGGALAFAPLKAWIPLDVQAVVHGSYKAVGSKLRFDCSLFDVESETRIVGKFYTGPPRAVRQTAHKFADEIVYRYTGKRGVAHTSIAYIKKGKDGRKEIHIMDYDGHNSYRLTHDNSIALSPDWSPNGGKLVFTSYRDRNPDVYMIDLRLRSYVRVSGFIGLNTTPEFSPDGKTLALTLSKSGNPEIYLLDLEDGELQIYIVDREGVNLRRITFNGYNNTSPAWSPNGDKIAYVSMVRGKGEIYTIHPTGTGLHRLTFDGRNEDPSWSPGGRYLAYSSRQAGRRDIYLMRADGSGKRRVTFGGGDNMSPAWSP